MRFTQLRNCIVALIVLAAVAMDAACSGSAPGSGDGAASGGGGPGGVAGTSGAAGGAKGEGGAVGGAAGSQAPAACAPPTAPGGSAGVELEFTSTWCNGARSCATCVWDVIKTVPAISAMLVPTTTACTFMPIVCPAASGVTAASPASCSFHPDAGRYDGAPINGYPAANQCQALDNELVGLASFPFEVSPCTLDGFLCVPDCSACP